MPEPPQTSLRFSLGGKHGSENGKHGRQRGLGTESRYSRIASSALSATHRTEACKPVPLRTGCSEQSSGAAMISR